MTRIVSSRSGEVDNSATGHWINSSIRLTYLIAAAGRSAHDRAPAVFSRPAFHLFIDRGAARLMIGGDRQVIHPHAVQIIADADFQRLEPVQHVQLGQRNARHARWWRRSGAPEPHRTSRSGVCARSRCQTHGPARPDVRHRRQKALPGTGLRRRGWYRPSRCPARNQSPWGQVPTPVAACPAITVLDEVTKG